ncbi:MAG: twin-arginine translocation signal domain-containing protein [Kofleriaceae bacterium]
MGLSRRSFLRGASAATILVTGLTRDGTYLIENGAVTRPVTNFRFNESRVQIDLAISEAV